MAILKILCYPNPALRQKAEVVSEVNDDIRTILENMAETMYDAPGVGLAAPQVGISKRLVVIDVSSYEQAEEEENDSGKLDADMLLPRRNLYKLVNPEIVSRDGEVEFEEGCLSIPNTRDTVKRSKTVQLEALNENGEKISIEADGVLAVCIQHEIDHLDGVLFIDHLSNLKQQIIKNRFKKKALLKKKKKEEQLS